MSTLYRLGATVDDPAALIRQTIHNELKRSERILSRLMGVRLDDDTLARLLYKTRRIVVENNSIVHIEPGFHNKTLWRLYLKNLSKNTGLTWSESLINAYKSLLASPRCRILAIATTVDNNYTVVAAQCHGLNNFYTIARFSGDHNIIDIYNTESRVTAGTILYSMIEALTKIKRSNDNPFETIITAPDMQEYVNKAIPTTNEETIMIPQTQAISENEVRIIADNGATNSIVNTPYINNKDEKKITIEDVEKWLSKRSEADIARLLLNIPKVQEVISKAVRLAGYQPEQVLKKLAEKARRSKNKSGGSKNEEKAKTILMNL